jgi:hypothetical protein
MTRGIAETRRRLVEWPLKYDAHTWPRSADRRTLRPTGRGEYGYNRVQEIVSGTADCYRLHFGRDVMELPWLVTPLLEKRQARREN